MKRWIPSSFIALTRSWAPRSLKEPVGRRYSSLASTKRSPARKETIGVTGSPSETRSRGAYCVSNSPPQSHQGTVRISSKFLLQPRHCSMDVMGSAVGGILSGPDDATDGLGKTLRVHRLCHVDLKTGVICQV